MTIDRFPARQIRLFGAWGVLVFSAALVSACGGGSAGGASAGGSGGGSNSQGTGTSSPSVSLASASPASATQGASNLSVTLTGTGLNTPGLSIAIAPSGTCTQASASADGKTLVLTCTMPSSGSSATITASVAGQSSSTNIALTTPPGNTVTMDSSATVVALGGTYTRTATCSSGTPTYSESGAGVSVGSTSGEVTATAINAAGATVIATCPAIAGSFQAGTAQYTIVVVGDVISAISFGAGFTVSVKPGTTSIVINRAPRAVQASITSLSATISVPAGATVTPGPNVTLDFSSPQTFKVSSGGQSATYTVTITPYNASTNPYGIYTATDLNDVRNDLAASYELESDITLPATDISGTNAACTEPFAGQSDYCSNGWLPLGSFTGTFSGAGHVVKGLEIYRGASNSPSTGLFSDDSGGTIQDVGVITGAAGVTEYDAGNPSEYVGILAGSMSTGTIAASFVQGTVKGGEYVGGLVGYQNKGTIRQCFAIAAVTATSYFGGGLVGASIGAVVTNSYAEGSANAYLLDAGGLIGVLNGFLSQSYANASAIAPGRVGGLAADTTTSTVVDGYFPVGQPDNGVGTVVQSGATAATFVGFSGSGFPTATPDIWTWVPGEWPQLSVPDGAWAAAVWAGAQNQVALP